MRKIKNIEWDCDDELVYNLLLKQVLAADSGCQLNDGFDFESLNEYKGD